VALHITKHKKENVKRSGDKMAGSIERRGKDSWRIVVSLGFDSEGKRIKRTKTIKAKTKREAQKELAKFVVEIESGEYITPEKMLFSAFLEEWKQKYAKKQLAPKTYETYVNHLTNRICPEFGHLRMDSIKPMHIINFLQRLQDKGLRKDGKDGSLSSATIQYHHRILKNIFSRAVEWKIIRNNPVSDIKKPKVTSKPTEVYTEQQVADLQKCLQNEKSKWILLINLALTTGIRRSELLGLEWKHVDLNTGTIQIRQVLSRTKEDGYVLKEPKTRNSQRKIIVPEYVISLLKEYKKQVFEEKLSIGDQWKGDEKFFLFTTWDGLPMHPSSITSWWRKFIKRNQLPFIRFHDLRHTSATLLINKGAHMKTISARLGHASISTTMNIYGHALEEADKSAASMFNNLFKYEKKEQA
jgi:integrase